jgi:hypothetical protein
MVRFETVLILTQESCKVCAERRVGFEVVWTQPMELLGDVGLVESRFGPFGDSVSVRA